MHDRGSCITTKMLLSKNADVSIAVMHVESITSFYGVETSEHAAELFSLVDQDIAESLVRRKRVGSIKIDDLVLAPYAEPRGETQYYRALVTRVKPEISVFFVDYGNAATFTSLNVLIEAPLSLRQIPFLAVKYELAHVQATRRNCERSRLFLNKLLNEVENFAKVKIYSIVSNTARVELFVEQLPVPCVNELLVRKDLCEQVPESLYSKQEHQVWESAEHAVDQGKDDAVIAWSHWKEVDRKVRGVACAPVQNHSKQRGPYSSLESKFYSLINIGERRNVKVCHTSINGVSICQDIVCPDKPMMVAASVRVSQTGGTMVCRDTTVLPPIPHLSSLLCLLFTPVIELRVSDEKTRYTGALCGLGSTTSNDCNGGSAQALLPEHDIEVVFDCDVNMEDIAMVNAVRMTISLAVGNSGTIASWSKPVIRKMQMNARDKIIEFLYKKRRRCVESPCLKPYIWGQVHESEVLHHKIHEQYINQTHFYSLHKAVFLENCTQ